MKICLHCKQSKDLKLFYASKNGSQGVHAYCKQCTKLRSSIWQKQNKERVNKKNLLWNKNNPERRKTIIAKSTSKNIVKIRKRHAAYKKANPEKENFHVMKRIAAKLQRTPKWLTKSDWTEIRWAYQFAHNITKETGVKHVVDHIIPLQGKEISGLHCPQNLQIITARENESKGNKFQPGVIPRQ